jgi:hypothetical protein
MYRRITLPAVGVVCAVLAGAAAAYGGTHSTIRMSWDTCDPQTREIRFTGPTSYRLVFSAADFTPGPTADDNVGTEIEFLVYPAGIPDAWRFDDEGCQTGSQIIFSSSGLSGVCPALKGGNPFAITHYGFEPLSRVARVRLLDVYDTLVPAPNTRYTVWQVTFDMAYAVAGPGAPPETCGGADVPVLIALQFATLLTLRGESAALQTAPGDLSYVYWNHETGPVNTLPATWGHLKGLYR